MKKPTVLILYASYGAGHKRAADAIEEKLKNTMNFETPLDIKKVDFLGEKFPLIDAFMRKLYIQSFRWAKPFYKSLYYKTKDLPIDSSVTSLFSYLGSLKLEAYIREQKADLVVSTFPALTGMLSQIKKRKQTSFKLYCVLTDYTTHNHWLYQHVDHYFVPTEAIKQEFIDRGISGHTLQATGIPVLPQFETKLEKSELRKKWELDPEKKTVLVSAGAFGVTNLKEACLDWVHSFPHLQFIVVCGRNKKLYASLSQVKGIKALGFTDKIDELLQASDLFVTKAGGLSISEAIATETPMILFGSLPGQETENVQFLTNEQVAKEANTPQEVSEWLKVIFEGKSEDLEEMKASVHRLNEQLMHHERWLQTLELDSRISQFYVFNKDYRTRIKLLYNRVFNKQADKSL